MSLTKLLELISKSEYDNEVVESSGLKLPTGIFFSQFFIEALVANFNEHKMYLPHWFRDWSEPKSSYLDPPYFKSIQFKNNTGLVNLT